MTEKNFIISAGLRDALMQYLLSRPCGEVMEGVIALRNLQPAEDWRLVCMNMLPPEEFERIESAVRDMRDMRGEPSNANTMSST